MLDLEQHRPTDLAFSSSFLKILSYPDDCLEILELFKLYASLGWGQLFHIELAQVTPIVLTDFAQPRARLYLGRNYKNRQINRQSTFFFTSVRASDAERPTPVKGIKRNNNNNK